MAGLYHGHLLEFPRIRVDCFTTGTSNKFIPLPLAIDNPSTTEKGESSWNRERLRASAASKVDTNQGHSRDITSEYYAPPTAQYHLLTHAHTDHLLGLSSIASSSASGSNITIICSEETKALVLAYETKNARTSFDREEEDVERRCEASKEEDEHEDGMDPEQKPRLNQEGKPGKKRNQPSDARLPRKRPKKLYEGLGPRSLEAMTRSGERQRAWLDCFRTIPYNTVVPLCMPVFQSPRFAGHVDKADKALITTTTTINLVMLDANHCPGSSMFLIYSGELAVLHTGDVRADSVFLAALRRNPLVQPFLSIPGRKHRTSTQGISRQLDRIYLDTSAFIGTTDMLTKEQCIDDLIDLIDSYPGDWAFHFDCWTFGYEDVLKAVSREFNTLVHLDRWRYDNFQRLSRDPMLLSVGSRDPQCTRFHACERNAPCQAVIDAESQGKLVVINFVEEKVVEHEIKMKAIRGEIQQARRGMCGWPKVLYCPLARHSPLPELQSLVDLFRPRSISPNTLIPGYNGYDYHAMLGAFRDCLNDDACRNIEAECLAWFRHTRGADLSRVDLRMDYKMAFGMPIESEPKSKTVRYEIGSDDLQEIKPTRDDIVLQRSRQANASHQAAAFLTSASSTHAQSAIGWSSRSFFEAKPDTNFMDDCEEKKPAMIKPERNDEDNIRSTDRANSRSKRSLQVHDQEGQHGTRTPGKETAGSTQPAWTNVRMKLRYGTCPTL